MRFTARWSASRSRPSARASKVTTWPQAWTPASVRPAQVSRTGWRSTRSSAAASVPATVFTPGFGANPENGFPS